MPWPRRLVAGLLAAALAGCALPVHRNAGDPPAGPPVISQAAARRVLSAYIATDNEANRLRSSSLLATCEGGSAERIDAAGYTDDRAAHPKSSSYQPQTYAGPVFYIPRQWSYPRWFVVRAKSRRLVGPGTAPESGYTYLVFAKRTAAAPWLVVLEPDSTAEGKPPPQVGLGSGAGAHAHGAGRETVESPRGRLAVPPSRLASVEAGYLDGADGTAKPFGTDKISGQLLSMAPADRKHLAAAHPSVSDRFVPGTDGTFAMATTDGGALVLYSVTDTLQDQVPAPYRLNIREPLYSGSGLSELQFTHVTQFAAYDPPPSKGKPDVLASNFGTTSVTGS